MIGGKLNLIFCHSLFSNKDIYFLCNSTNIYIPFLRQYNKQEEEVKKAIRLIHEYSLKIDIANRTLLLLDVVVHAHQNISRYPCEEHGESPLDIYSIDHPIIQRFEKLLEYTFLSLRLTDEVIQAK